MNIQLVTNNYSNVPQKTFKAGCHNYRVLQNIPGINCSCCGRDVINLENVANTYQKVTKPLAEVMQSGLLDKWKDVPYLWSVLSNLVKKYPDDSFDTIVQRDKQDFSSVRRTISRDIRMKYYGEMSFYAIESLAKRAYSALLYDTRQEMSPASKTLDNFKKYKKFFDDGPLKAFKILQGYAKKYPDKRLSEIVAMEEIYNYHKAKDEKAANKHSETVDLHFANILKLIRAEDPLALLHFRKLEKRARDVLSKEADPDARIPIIKELYTKHLQLMKCENIQDKVAAEIDQIPPKYSREHAFFVQAHDEGWSDANIIRNIYLPFSGTVDHLDALSRGGVDNVYNTSVMCYSCNKGKSNKSFMRHKRYHSDMPQHMKRQIEIVSNSILSEETKDEAMVRWPIFFSANLNHITDGEVKPDTSQYVEGILDLTKKKYDRNTTKIQALKDKNVALNLKKEELKQKIHEIYAEMSENLEEIEKLNAWAAKNDKDLDFFTRDNLDEYYYGSDVSAESEEHDEFTDDFSGDCS